MASINISAEDIIKVKFDSYLNNPEHPLEPDKATKFIDDMVAGAGSAIDAQVAELSGQFDSLMKQIPAFIQATGVEAGNAAAIAANSANPLAATASVSMLISLAASIQNLITMFNALRTSYDGFMAGASKLGLDKIESFASITAPLTALMGAIKDPEEEIPVPPPPKFPVTVVNGSGSGDYEADEEVSIVANDPAARFRFVSWVADNEEVEFVDKFAPETTFIMLLVQALTVTANYEQYQFPVTVVSGSGSGDYEVGSLVAIEASVVTGQVFSMWVCDNINVSFADPYSSSTSFEMISADVTVTATYV